MTVGPKDWLKLTGLDEGTKAHKLEHELISLSADYGKEDSNPTTEATYSAEQVRELAGNSLDFLAGIAMPTVYEFAFPPILLAVWGLLVSSIHKIHDFSQVALGIPRSHAKSTLIKLFVLYIILFTNRKFILIFAATAAKAENIVADISDFLDEINIIKSFGSWRPGIEMDRQDLKKFGFRGRNIIIAAIGAGGSVRGLNLKNERPDVIIFDDIQEKECADSEVQSKSLESWMVSTAMKAKSPRGCLTIFCGNMYPGPNSILKKLKKNPRWVSFTTGAILADGTALWEELRPLKDLLEELDNDIEMGQPEAFFSEVLNETDIAINSRIDLSKMGDWPWGEFELPQGKFLVIDPSPGKPGKDPTAIARVNVYDEKPGVIEIVEKILSPGGTIMTALLMCLKHNIKVIAIEGTAYQATLAYWFHKECERLGITGIEAVEVYHTQASKNSRITTMLKSLSAKEIILHPNVRSQVLHQIANWNPMKRDNQDGILDTLTYVPKVIEKYSDIIMSEESIMVIEANGAEVVEDNHIF